MEGHQVIVAELRKKKQWSLFYSIIFLISLLVWLLLRVGSKNVSHASDLASDGLLAICPLADLCNCMASLPMCVSVSEFLLLLGHQ